LAYAVRHLQKIRRLIILNTAAFPLPSGKRFPWQLRLCQIPFLGAFLVRRLNAFCKGAVRDCAMHPLAPEVQAMYLMPYDSWRNRIAVLRFVQDIPLARGHRSWPILEETEKGLEKLQGIPMLICWGERDFVFDRHFLKEWQRRFPAAEVERYPEAGHFVLEDAGSPILARVRAFLDRP
jgi:haloalkane dehalogenase